MKYLKNQKKTIYLNTMNIEDKTEIRKETTSRTKIIITTQIIIKCNKVCYKSNIYAFTSSFAASRAGIWHNQVSS